MERARNPEEFLRSRRRRRVYGSDDDEGGSGGGGGDEGDLDLDEVLRGIERKEQVRRGTMTEEEQQLLRSLWTQHAAEKDPLAKILLEEPFRDLNRGQLIRRLKSLGLWQERARSNAVERAAKSCCGVLRARAAGQAAMDWLLDKLEECADFWSFLPPGEVIEDDFSLIPVDGAEREYYQCRSFAPMCRALGLKAPQPGLRDYIDIPKEQGAAGVLRMLGIAREMLSRAKEMLAERAARGKAAEPSSEEDALSDGPTEGEEEEEAEAGERSVLGVCSGCPRPGLVLT